MAKFFRETKTYSELNPISGKQYFVFLLKTHIPLGISALLLVFLHNYLAETNIGLQTLFLLFCTISFFVLGIVVGELTIQYTWARLKSIDPEYPGGLLHSILLYGALPFTLTTFFLIFKKPKSMMGKLNKLVWTLLKFYTATVLSLLLVLAILVDKNETRAMIGTNAAYYLSGPATFYILHFLTETAQAHEFKDKTRDLPYDKLFPKLQERCHTQRTSTVSYQIVGAAALLKTKSKKDIDRDELFRLNKDLLKMVNECSPSRLTLNLYNPIWAFSEVTLAEASAMLMVERFINNLTILIFWPDKIPLDRKGKLSEVQKNKIEELKKASPVYHRAKQLKQYPILNWIHELLH